MEFVEVVLLDGGAEFCIGFVVDGDEFLLIDMAWNFLPAAEAEPPSAGALQLVASRARRKAKSFEFRVGPLRSKVIR